MSRTITIEVSEELYRAIARAAAANAQTPAGWLVRAAETGLPTPPAPDVPPDNPPAFAEEVALLDAEWQQWQAATTSYPQPTTTDAARVLVQRIRHRWAPLPVTTADALVIAHNEDIAAWNPGE